MKSIYCLDMKAPLGVVNGYEIMLRAIVEKDKNLCVIDILFHFGYKECLISSSTCDYFDV